MLTDREPPPFTVENADGASPIVLACDHASNLVPRALEGLGLVERELHRHIAWDQGAAAVARGLSGRLDAPAVLAGYSRLVIDCNRAPEHETSIAEVSDGTTVPGNAGISEAARAARKRTLFDPYHEALAGALERVRKRGRMPVLIAVHSFTPVLAGTPRPWQVSVLWGFDPRVPVPLLAALRRRGDLAVGGKRALFGAQPARPHHQGARRAYRDPARADRDPRQRNRRFERRGALCRYPGRRAGNGAHPAPVRLNGGRRWRSPNRPSPSASRRNISSSTATAAI